MRHGKRSQPRHTHWLAIVLLEGLFLILLSYSSARAESRGLFGLGGRTFGGGFTFSDEVVYQDWRIQKHAIIGHFRLIDPNDRRHARGSFEHCLEELQKIKVEKNLSPMPKEVVIVMHGLGASRKWMNSLSDYLEENGRLSVVNVGYPSTMGEIGTHANTLTNVIKHLDGVETVSFVAHSMGNIVIRHCLADMAAMPPSEQPQITYKRFVMIAPPNNGAGMAETVGQREMLSKLVEMVGGEAVDQLNPSKGWPTLEQRLATPNFEFGIIVGGQGDDEGYLPNIPGDDDMLLSVETSKLAGASDFAQVKGVHQTLPKNEQVQSYTLRFLEHGA
ncbi:MAG: esterase/lipase family protein, partial [Bythopirellula sp.]